MRGYIRRRATPPEVTPPEPPSQDEQRRRRRGWLPVAYTGSFRLSDEVSAICGPLAERVAAQPNSRAFGADVQELVAAVHEVVGTVVGWLAEVDGRSRTEHLAQDMRGKAVRRLVELAPRPVLPEITDEMLASGAWAKLLVSMAQQVDDGLAGLLGRSLPPGHDGLQGRPSVSDKLVELLREKVTPPEAWLRKRLERAEFWRSEFPPKPKVDPGERAREQARAELIAMGVEV
jgi:hypothetical protein